MSLAAVTGALKSVSALHVLAAVVAVVVAHVAAMLVRWWRRRRMYDHLPGDFNGLLGDLPHLYKNQDVLYDWDAERYLKYGKTFKETLSFLDDAGQIRTIDPRNLKHFLKDNFRNYVKPDFLRRSLRGLIGDGIFRINHGYEGEYPLWHAQRKTLSKIFFADNFRGFLLKVFERHSRTLCDVLRGHATAGTAVDMQRLMFCYTLDSIAEIGFGESFHALTGTTNIGDCFDQAQEHAFWHGLQPFHDVPVLGSLLYSDVRKMKGVLKELDAFSARIVRDHRAAAARAKAAEEAEEEEGGGGGKQNKKQKQTRGAAVGQDCLSLFLTNKFSDTAWTDMQLRDIIMSLLIAGRDTTACTLSFAVAQYLCNPGVAAQLRAELEEKLGSTTVFGGDEELTMEHFAQRNMPVLHGFVYEILRLHPPVPVELKYGVKADTWPDGTRVPAKTVVAFNIYAMGRDADVWPDPLVVRPERWNERTPSAFEFPVFQAGPRICLGLNMAVVEAKVALVHVFAAFDFTPTKECTLPPEYKIRVTQSVKGGVPVHVTARSPAASH